MNISRRKLLLCSASAAFLPLSRKVMAAQGTVPSGPYRLVVPYSPGGGADYVARLLAAKLQETVGWNVVVENRPGASGMIGTEQVARSPANGQVLLFADAGHSVNAAIHPNARYDPIRDFSPVTLVASSPQLLAANPSVPVNSLAELLALPPDKVKDWGVATTGQGSGAHLTYEMLSARTGLHLIHVPYKGGGPAINDALGGQVPLIINSVPALMPHLQAGRLKPLAIATSKRHPRLPDVQTFGESAPGIVATNWYGILAPAGTPDIFTATLSQHLERVMQMPDIQEKFSGAFLDPMPTGPTAFARFLGPEVQQWKDVVAETGVRMD
ncbi:Bug family tripartite tricarboxylate transporter substrate binding protein [Bordetella genomosp. 5]|uniref:ABC transporter substrate-binding protein n=1 Tax=Bordetella genomosp. 5 TaxID=1395608 RepID=A0A261TYD5_9BORD|nr:tripartite tricarboxylate transporter substrate binding protein [Bordetella genomosp. 5]OZI53633.1 ABC transporter substrate-binding protein [Bordetella genomosp. 5]